MNIIEEYIKNERDIELDVKKETSCDLVVIGSGPAGLSAAVQAKELGLNVIIVEVNDKFGGNGEHTEGVFAINSVFQKEQNINITLREIIEAESKTFNYHIDTLKWKDLVENSGENISWLLEHGVGFSGVVDECKGNAKIKPYHWFYRRESDGRGDGNLLVNPLINSAQKQGIPMYDNTRAVRVLSQDGVVNGLYTVNTVTLEVTKFTCGAVVVATGGFVDNDEMMADRGFNVPCLFHRGNPGHQGDGLRMAVELGAEDVSRRRAYLDKIYIYPLSPYSLTNAYINLKGYTLWVNADGERFNNEFCGEHVPCYYSNAKLTQAETWAVFDSSFVERFSSEAKDMVSDIESLVGNEYKNCFRADSIEELASLSGINADVFCTTVDRYNSFCKTGVDEDFSKDKSRLLPIVKAPFYMVRQDLGVWTSIGAIRTNRRYEVVTPAGKTIPGLYCAGVDGCELYWDCYTITVPGSANGHNVNSGRTAARSAFSYLKKQR